MLLDEGESFVEQFHLCPVLHSRWGRRWWKGAPLVDLLLPIFPLPARPHKARASPRLVHGLGVMSRWDKLPHHLTMVRLIPTNMPPSYSSWRPNKAPRISFKLHHYLSRYNCWINSDCLFLVPCCAHYKDRIYFCQVSIECGQMWSATKTSKLLRCRRNLLHVVSSPISKLTISLIPPLGKIIVF